MADSTVRISLDAKLYRGAAGSKATTEVDTCADVAVKMKKGEAKISRRKSKWAMFRGTIKEYELEISFVADTADQHLAAFIAAFTNDTPISLYVTDREGGLGLDADFEVMSMDDDQKIEDAIGYKFTCKPTFVVANREPKWQ